jgi:hypothetical protein
MGKKYTVHILIAILILLTSCSRKPSVILEDNTCDAPCWRGIVPGQSTIENVEVILDSMTDIHPPVGPENTLANNPYYEKQIGWEFDSVTEYRGVVYFRNDIVTLINISMENDLPLADIILKFGEPTDVLIQSMVGDPAVYLTVKLIYPDKGICLSHQPSFIFPFKNPKSYRIKPSTKIRNVMFIDHSVLEGQLEFGCLAGIDDIIYSANKQNWKGYGDYGVLVWE